MRWKRCWSGALFESGRATVTVVSPRKGFALVKVAELAKVRSNQYNSIGRRNRCRASCSTSLDGGRVRDGEKYLASRKSANLPSGIV